MGDHGGSAVDVAKGLPQQHCQFAVPTRLTLLLANGTALFHNDNKGS